MKKGKKKIKTVRFTGKLLAVFVLMMGLYILSCTLLKPYNVSLNNEKQNVLTEIAVLKNENELARIEIKKLSDYDRVMEIAQDNNMSVENGTVSAITH